MKMLEQRVKLDITFVHKIVRVGFCWYFIHNWRIVNCFFRQMNKCRDGTPKIHLGIYLDGSSLMIFYSLFIKNVDISFTLL